MRASLDRRSLVIWGVPRSTSMLALRKCIHQSLYRTVPPRFRNAIRRVEIASRDKGCSYIRVVCEDELSRNQLLGPLTKSFRKKRKRWSVAPGRPIAERRLLRRMREAGRTSAVASNPSNHPEASIPPLPPQPDSAGNQAARSRGPAVSMRRRRRKRRRRVVSGMNALRLATININAWGSSKPEELRQRCEALGLDIVAVTESHLTGNFRFPSISGFT